MGKYSWYACINCLYKISALLLRIYMIGWYTLVVYVTAEGCCIILDISKDYTTWSSYIQLL